MLALHPVFASARSCPAGVLTVRVFGTAAGSSWDLSSVTPASPPKSWGTPSLMSTPPHGLAALDLDGAEVGEVLRVGEKSVLARGRADGKPVVIKALSSDEQVWRATFAREIELYRIFATHPPPVRVPELVHTDGHTVLIVEELAGERLAGDRYPEHPVTETALTAALQAITAFARWHPPSGVLAPVFDYSARVQRYHQCGFFDATDRDVLHALLDDLPPPAQPAHGDPLPSNLMLDEHGECGLLDFEFTGLLLPGFDLAMLHTLLATTPKVDNRVQALIRDADIEVPFLINQAIVLAREWRLHTELPDSSHRTRTLAILRSRWSLCRDRLHHPLR